MNPRPPVAGTPIVPPPDFPVRWERPEDAAYYWTRDREHMPRPITPMFSSFTALAAGEGRRLTVPLYEEAILERRDCTINGYDYTRVIVFDGKPAEIEARIRRNREKTWKTCRKLAELWEEEWLPEIESHWAFWAAFDLHGASPAVLAGHLQETMARAIRLYEIHYLMGPPMWFAIDEFETFYCDLFPDATPLDAHRLLQGFDNKTLEAGRELWRLSRLAKTSAAVCALLRRCDAAAAWAQLQTLDEAAPFVQELRRYLSDHGRRCDLWDWGYPSWEEDPAPLLNNLKNYLEQPDRNLEAELLQAAAEREAAVARTRSQLRSYPGPVIARFEELLYAAQVALVLSENHTYYIDFNGLAWVRRVIAEFGRRLAGAGRLEQPADVFYLKLNELYAMIEDPLLEYGELAAQRHADAQRWAAQAEPLELGTRPPAAPRLYSADARRMARYLGIPLEGTPAPAEPGLLRGQGGSAGKVRGRARVIHTLADAHRLQPGDILVTATTAPPWTPLFLTAAGLVTDAGGLLSHGAVVAREYHIPAVVGTHTATGQIVDGQWLEVDGDQGLVHVLEGC